MPFTGDSTQLCKAMTVTASGFKRQLLRMTFQWPYTACWAAGRRLPVFTFQPFTYPCSASNCVIFRVIIILARWQPRQPASLQNCLISRMWLCCNHSDPSWKRAVRCDVMSLYICYPAKSTYLYKISSNTICCQTKVEKRIKYLLVSFFFDKFKAR